MNSTPLLFLGILVGLAGSWWGMLVAPMLQLGTASTVVVKPSGQHYPPMRPGMGQQGAAVYQAEGCNTCHSQLLRPAGYGFDLRLGWGPRRTVAQDYLRDQPVMLGSVRIGPDLANVGSRMGAGDTNAEPALLAYHLKHLYRPRSVMPGSVMPAYPYLFEKRRMEGAPSPDALNLDGDLALEPGYEIVPKPEARALMSYLLSLRATLSLAEAPIPPPPTNQVESANEAIQGTIEATTPAADPTR